MNKDKRKPTDEKADASRGKDTTVVIIKPEEIESGRAEQVLSFIKDFCANNGLQMEVKKAKLTKQVLGRHYFGRGQEYLQNVGFKILRSLGEKTDDSQKAIKVGEDVLRIHADSYIDKEAIVLKITGEDALNKIKSIKGSTEPEKSANGTIRKVFSTGMTIADVVNNRKPLRNIVHISENEEEAKFDLRTFWSDSKDIRRISRR